MTNFKPTRSLSYSTGHATSMHSGGTLLRGGITGASKCRDRSRSSRTRASGIARLFCTVVIFLAWNGGTRHGPAQLAGPCGRPRGGVPLHVRDGLVRYQVTPAIFVYILSGLGAAAILESWPGGGIRLQFRRADGLDSRTRNGVRTPGGAKHPFHAPWRSRRSVLSSDAAPGHSRRRHDAPHFR